MTVRWPWSLLSFWPIQEGQSQDRRQQRSQCAQGQAQSQIGAQQGYHWRGDAQVGRGGIDDGWILSGIHLLSEHPRVGNGEMDEINIITHIIC